MQRTTIKRNEFKYFEICVTFLSDSNIAVGDYVFDYEGTVEHIDTQEQMTGIKIQ